MNTSKVPTSEASLIDSFGIASESGQPLFVPTRHFTDDRGWSLMNQMQGVMSDQGQINFSVQYPGVIKAWHRHRLQTDFWTGLIGHLKVGVYDQEKGIAWSIVIGEKCPGTVLIPPTLWHGAATVGPTPAGLLYYVTHSYNPAAPDEERVAHDVFPGFPWHVEHK